MLLHDIDQTPRPAITDAIIMGDHDDSLGSSGSSPCQDDTLGEKDEPANPAIIHTNGTTPQKCKKRVQFLPDGALVRIRVIPPRSNKSSSESDGSADDSSDSDDSDSETSTESEQCSSDRDTPSPALPTESKNKFATMPPLMYAAKGSYNVSKPSNKNSLLVAKITGINRPTSPSSPTPKIKKLKRVGSPKPERPPKKTAKKIDKPENEKRLQEENRAKARKKRVPYKFKEGKISPPPPVKSNKTPLSSKTPVKLSQRRANNVANTSKTPVAAKRFQASTVSTSLKALSTSSSTSTDMSLERVSRAMQSLSMGKLYTIDGFIFPPHHASQLQLPDLSVTSKSEDFGPSAGGDLTSPRRSISSLQQQANQSQAPQQISPTSANRRKRLYAWQMANDSIQNTLTNTPNISQLWDNVSVHSESVDKSSVNIYQHM